MRIGTKSFLGLSLKQVGLRFIHPLKVSSPPFSRSCRLYSSPSTSLPTLCTKLFSVSLYSFIYVMIPFLIICSADRLENYLKYKFCLLSCGSLSDAKIGRHWEGKVLAKLGRGDIG